MDRADIVHKSFLDKVANGNFPSGNSPSGSLSFEEAITIFRAQCLSRHLDRTSRKMQAADEGFYTIGSSGHEGMAAVASALRPTDMAFLHYRDGAFQTRRSTQVPGTTPTWDMLLSFSTSKEDPISGGRHKVLGSKSLAIPPQTSTIASHLPKAVGAAFSIGLAKRSPPEHKVLEDDSLVMCSFGDASSNHSTAQGAINTACWTSFQNSPLPLLFVCEDNGIGISTRTPSGWVAANFSNRPGLKYFHADGLDIYDTYNTCKEAAAYARGQKKPVFLHLSMVRLYGHAGSDMQQTYLSKSIYEGWEEEYPLLHSSRLLLEAGALDTDGILAIYTEIDAQCTRVSKEVITRPRLNDGDEVMSKVVPPKRYNSPTNGPSIEERKVTFGSDLRHISKPQHMSRLINWALTDLMVTHKDIVMMGEDVGRKGGVYGVYTDHSKIRKF